jgi:hypothetical protein
MANVTSQTAYNLDLGTGAPVGFTFAFPTQGCLLGDCSASPQRVLLPGSLSAYSFIQFQGQKYYSTKTLATLVSDFG